MTPARKETTVLSFQKITDFARSHKNYIVSGIMNTVSSYDNNRDFSISVSVLIGDPTKPQPLSLTIGEECDNIVTYPNLNLLSVDIDNTSRNFSYEDWLMIVDCRLKEFERRVNNY